MFLLLQPERVLPKVDTFQYDVELDSKEDFALATKLAMLERKNQKLLDQVPPFSL